MIFAYVPFLEPLGEAVGPHLVSLMPIVLFALLYVTFCKIEIKEMKPKAWHFILQLIRTSLALMMVVLIFEFGNDYNTHDGTGVRDFIHVVDLARGHVAAIEYMKNHKGENVFNLGTGTGYSVLDMVKAFERVTGQKIPYVIAPRRPGDVAENFANCDKAYRELGWKAKFNIIDACRDAYRFQQKNPNGIE